MKIIQLKQKRILNPILANITHIFFIVSKIRGLITKYFNILLSIS